SIADIHSCPACQFHRGRRRRGLVGSLPENPAAPMVRISELTRGGNLYAIRMVAGKQRMTLLRTWLRRRSSLGVAHRRQITLAPNGIGEVRRCPSSRRGSLRRTISHPNG